MEERARSLPRSHRTIERDGIGTPFARASWTGPLLVKNMKRIASMSVFALLLSKERAWQKSGWTGYDPASKTFDADEMRRERQLYGSL